METKTKHYAYTQKEVDQFNYKYDSHFKEIHKYSFWFVSLDIDDDRSETYFDNQEEAYIEYQRIKQSIQDYPPIQHFVHAQGKEIILSLMCHNVFKDENGEDVFWKMNIRNEEFLEMDERDSL